METTEIKKTSYFSKPKDFLVLFLGIFATLYMLNFTFGVVEFLPDTLPFVGNIDEALATYVVYSVLVYFDMNPKVIFKK